MSKMTTIVCRDCGADYSYPPRRGRPAVRCEKCQEIFKQNPSASPSVVAAASSSRSQSNKLASIFLGEDDLDNIEVSIEDNANETVSTEPIVSASSDEKAKAQAEARENVLKNSTYQVYMGNMGWIYRGEDKTEATKVFNIYCRKSAQGYGQVGFETVSFLEKGKDWEHFVPQKKAS